MKAIIRKSAGAKILAANLSPENSDKLSALAKKYGAEVITVGDLQSTPANLLGEKSSAAKDSGKYPDSDDECLLFVGFGANLDKFLDGLKAQSVNVPLKAMYTPHNRDWSFAHLIHDLNEEHRHMTGGEAK
jgi:hypothetical protein